MHTISHDTISHAWNDAFQRLVANGGKAVHLAVAIARPLDPEEETIRSALDAFIEERRAAGSPIWPVSTVANTIFPAAFYRPERENARQRLYDLHAKAQRIQQRMPNPENYFNRLVAYPAPGSEPFNQLEYIVDRLVRQRKPRKGGRGGALSSAYEVGLTVPDGGELRVQAPGQDRRLMSFPCLSQISFTLEGDTLNLAALYRNQYFVTRAYGNYLGLARIGDFISREVGVELGEIVCLATHADAQFGELTKTRVERLATTLRESSASLEAVSA
jgi:hypothetical protein